MIVSWMNANWMQGSFFVSVLEFVWTMPLKIGSSLILNNNNETVNHDLVSRVTVT